MSAPSQAVIPTEVDQSLFLLDGRMNTLSMFAACGSLVSASGRAVRVDAVQARRYTLRPHSDTSKAYFKVKRCSHYSQFFLILRRRVCSQHHDSPRSFCAALLRFVLSYCRPNVRCSKLQLPPLVSVPLTYSSGVLSHLFLKD
jgi:hypothetical protein